MTASIADNTTAEIANTASVTVSLLAPVARFSLRVGEAERAAVAAALGVDLPERIGRRIATEGIEALCLGPDEWLVLAPETEAGRIAESCATAYADAPHSLTEITDREVTVRIEGQRAPELLTLGCPRDIDRLPVGEARRTVFDGVAIVLWRDADQSFRFDVWRSFAPHVIGLLETGCAEFSVEYAAATT